MQESQEADDSAADDPSPDAATVDDPADLAPPSESADPPVRKRRSQGLGATSGSLANYRAQLARLQSDPLVGVRQQLARLQVDPYAGVRQQLARAQMDPYAGVRRQLAAQIDPFAGVRQQLARAQAGPFVRIGQQLTAMQAANGPLGNFQAQMIRWQEVGPFASLQTQLNAARASLKHNDALLEGVRAQIAAALDPLAAALHGIADQALAAYPVALLEQITRTRSLWIPANLRHLRPAMWAWLFRVSAKDGVCFAWAPRRSIIDELLNLQTSQERHQLLLHRRQEVVVDVLGSLREVEHPELMTYVAFATEAAACIQDGRYAAAQAMLGNILDSALRAHGRAWFRHNFGVFSISGDSNHKLVRGVLSRHNGVIIGGLSTMLGPYLLATSLKNAFDGPQKHQSTFNRNLTAHHVTKGTYRNEFALTTLLVVQGLLRQLDGYLCSEPALPDGGSEDDGSEWTAVLNEAITVFNALNSAVSKETFAKAVKDADPKEYMAKRVNVMSALHGFKSNLPPAPLVYGPAPVCETCGKGAVPGPAAARRGKPGTYWWCETCTARLGDRKPL